MRQQNTAVVNGPKELNPGLKFVIDYFLQIKLQEEDLTEDGVPRNSSWRGHKLSFIADGKWKVNQIFYMLAQGMGNINIKNMRTPLTISLILKKNISQRVGSLCSSMS